MKTTITAVVEGGLLRPAVPLQLPEGTKIELIIVREQSANTDMPTVPPDADPLESVVGAVSSKIPDWADQHDRYLAEGLTATNEELGPGS
jgi:Protein of unknown function DUF104